MKVAITGHRPEKIPDELDVKMFLRREFERFKPEVVIQGLASGVDLWAGEVAIKMGIAVVSVKPWKGHKPRIADKPMYDWVVANSKSVVNVTDYENYPGAWVYQRRNEWMVDHADRVLAVWDGTPGGTSNCYKYAHKVHVPVVRMHPKLQWVYDENDDFI